MIRALLSLALLLAACQNLHATSTDPEVSERDCFTCHAADYESAPNHPGLRPTTCADCHATTSWAGLHPEGFFAITSGPHEGAACDSCHKPELGANLGGENTDCIHCHTGDHNDRARMDDKHRDVSGYLWSASDPNNCLSCHPAGLVND